jgi:predicted membrane GTPase involved in stress response
MSWRCPSRAWCSDIDGERHEPIELVTADIEEQHQGGVMQALGERKGELVNMEPRRPWPCAPGIPHSRRAG